MVGETVVLLMTDVEGSTATWRTAPAAMDQAMRRHHEILHGAIEQCGGWRPQDQGEGDSVFGAFGSATGAVRAAVATQRALQAEAWPDGAALRVRMGVHAGEVLTRGGNLYGDTVNRCARVRGVAAGGQVVLSSSVFELVRDRLDDGVTLLELGEHRLKDLTRAERLYQLQAEGLDREFPPLRSLDRAQHNLPVQGSTFVGRERELAEVVTLLRSERLVTLTGFGGMGKTRLALQAAAELANGDGDGVWFVDLSTELLDEQVPAAVARALGVRESGTGAADAVVRHLEDKHLLLVLDNLEQVMGAVPFIADLLGRCPGITLLATSREPLRLRAEHEYALAPLAVPSSGVHWDDDVERLGTYEAVRLLVDRAVSASRGFTITNESAPAVAAIVARLDGHPLAIELAAARLKVLSPQMLLSRLDSALTVLSGAGRDQPLRHQTLHATIAWSYDLLPSHEKALLDRLSVFVGAPTLEAIEDVCLDDSVGEISVLDGMAALVDKSLLRSEDDPRCGERRYGLLGSIRGFAAEQLERTGDTPRVRDRHAAYYCTLARVTKEWDPRAEDEALSRMAGDVNEVRAAFDHLALTGDPLDVPWTLFEHLTRAGQLTEAISRGQTALKRTPAPDQRRIHVLHQVAWSLEASGLKEQSWALWLVLLHEARELGAREEVAFALAQLLLRSGGTEQALQLADDLEHALDDLGRDDLARQAPELISHVTRALCSALRYLDPARGLEYATALRDHEAFATDSHMWSLNEAMVARAQLATGDLVGACSTMARLDLSADSGVGRSRLANLRAQRAHLDALSGDLAAARTGAHDAVAAASALEDTSPLAELLLADLDLIEGAPTTATQRCEALVRRLPAEDRADLGRARWRAALAAWLTSDPGRAQELIDGATHALADREVSCLPDVLATALVRAHLVDDEDGVRRKACEITERLPWTEIPLALQVLIGNPKEGDGVHGGPTATQDGAALHR